MASRPTGFLRLAPLSDGSEVWRAQVRTLDGRRRQRTLGRAWTKKSRPPAGYLTRSQAEARLQAILAGGDPSVQLEPAPGAHVSFNAAVREWLRYVEHDRKRRHSTVRDYEQEARHLLAEFGADTPLAAITTERIEQWRRRLVAEGRLAPRTTNKRRGVLSQIFKRAQRLHSLPANPVDAVERQPERPSGDFNVLDPAEVYRVVGVATSEQDGAIFLTAAFTGLRMGEVRALRWEDVSWSLGLIHVRRSYTHGDEGAPKSSKVRSTPLSDPVARALDQLSRRERWTGEQDLVFVNKVGGFLDESALRRRFYRALEAAGLGHLREQRGNRKPIVFHDLRHSFGTLAIRRYPLSDVQAYMGHAHIQTTMRYIHHQPQHDAAAQLTELIEEATSASAGCIPGCIVRPRR